MADNSRLLGVSRLGSLSVDTMILGASPRERIMSPRHSEVPGLMSTIDEDLARVIEKINEHTAQEYVH